MKKILTYIAILTAAAFFAVSHAGAQNSTLIQTLSTKEFCQKVDDINAELISNSIYTAGQPDPDLIIRPSGEFRVSNFLLWQSAYAEYYISDKLWPDFSTDDLDKAIAEFSTRNRRYGGV